jgi:hypothetical protein
MCPSEGHQSWCAILWLRGGGYCNCGLLTRAYAMDETLRRMEDTTEAMLEREADTYAPETGEGL